jgi:hypothetical protein
MLRGFGRGKGDLESGKRKLGVVYCLCLLLKKEAHEQILLLPLVWAIENLWDILNICH